MFFQVEPTAKTLWASELCPRTRILLRETLGPDVKIYTDMFQRDSPKRCDVYVAGPTCQPWSSSGDTKENHRHMKRRRS